MRDFQFQTSIICSINYNASIIESNIQCDVMEIAWRNSQCRLAPLFYNKRVHGRESSLTYNERMWDIQAYKPNISA